MVSAERPCYRVLSELERRERFVFQSEMLRSRLERSRVDYKPFGQTKGLQNGEVTANERSAIPARSLDLLRLWQAIGQTRSMCGQSS